MSLLQEKHPSVFQDFMQWFHVIRRDRSRAWAGISPDQIIEQTLMRSAKLTGGLTQGTGFCNAQQNIFLIFKTRLC